MLCLLLGSLLNMLHLNLHSMCMWLHCLHRMLLLLLFFTGSYLLFKKNDSAKVKLVLFLGMVAYLSFGSYVYFFHKMVFEGRVLHIYYPFIIIGVLGLLQQMKLWKIPFVSTVVVFFAFIKKKSFLLDQCRCAY